MTDFASSTSPRPSEDNEDESSNRETTLLNQTSSYALNNFKAAYKAVQQQQTKTIVRGRKTFAFWTLVVLLFLLAVGNLILTMTILGVLRIGSGMESIELIPQEQTLKFFGEADLGNIHKQDGIMRNFNDENLDITAENSSVLLSLYTRPNRDTTQMAVEQNGTRFSKLNSFRIQTSKKELLFDAGDPSFGNLKNANNFKSKTIETNKVRSKLNETLKIQGDKVHLKGSEGSKIEGLLHSHSSSLFKNFNFSSGNCLDC